VAREGLEVAHVFRHFGPAFRDQNGVSLSTARRRAMIAIESRRTAALGGHVLNCGGNTPKEAAMTRSKFSTKAVLLGCRHWPVHGCVRCIATCCRPVLHLSGRVGIRSELWLHTGQG
jgi:hypothetical protein